ncbi:glutamate receptor ionotropic, kainate 3-like isoform X2 [Venturia canescens]|uniref:glutamate receptor ionotropic, kainate 3-like isoform X2 n=1 Tax=Venturia canescens TaxID=32260 RepID=UPI001C9C874B|nr:glutamate receptor ionotropic, kainate 3-like isoform X2 [Venturia canescens]
MKEFKVSIYSTLILLPWVYGLTKKVTLGALFGENDPCQQAFVLSVNAVNKLRRTTNDLANVHFVPDSRSTTNSTFEISQSACSLLGKGVVGIFGPSERVSAEHVQSMCETVDVPNIVARWDIEPGRMQAFNFHPASKALTMALYDLITEFEWKKYTILYDSSESLARTNELLKKWGPDGYPVTIRHLGKGPVYRDVLIEIRKTEVLNVVIDCSSEILEQVLREALQVGILSHRHRVIVNNLDLHTIDLEPYQYSGVNFTGFRLVDVNDPRAQKTYKKFLSKMGLEKMSQLPVQAALIFDGVQFFARAFKRARNVKNYEKPVLSCDGSGDWDFGTILSNSMRTTEMNGLTGLVKFDGNGFRSDFVLDIVQLGRTGLKKIGIYSSVDGVDWHLPGDGSAVPDVDDLHNNTLRVLISLIDPYNMLKESSDLLTGNDRYEGFTIDIIHEIAKILRFNYTFIESDSDYGSPGKDGKWTGMLGAIIDGEADLGISDLTITAERESAVEFTVPFLNLGISILYRKPTKAAPSPFSFLLPFTPKVWIHILGAYLFVSLLICIVGRMSPSEWQNSDPCEQQPQQLENQWVLTNAFWFTMGTLMQQGSDVVPIGPSTRGVCISWAFFRLIMVYTYTASLASFLVVETIVRPIKSAEDLANLDGHIKYGAKAGGSTYTFFKTANYSTYAKMFKYMEDNAADVLTEDNDEGTERVYDKNQNYAFLMESSSIQYIVQRACNLTQIGGLLDSKGYGIAMRKTSGDWSYRSVTN